MKTQIFRLISSILISTSRHSFTSKIHPDIIRASSGNTLKIHSNHVLNISNSAPNMIRKSNSSPNLKYKEIIKILYPDYEKRTDCLKLDLEIGSMKEIDLSGKNLEVFPKLVLQLRNITKINISNNSIREIPEDIVASKSLAYIDLSNNQLEIFPTALSKFTNLKHLDLSGNCISEFPDYPKRSILETDLSKSSTYFNTLEHLDLSGNFITKVPEYFFELNNLKSLILNDNQIYEIMPEANLPDSSLETLSLCRNRLTVFDMKIHNLKMINLSGNFIEAFPASLGVSKSLESINLSNNALKELPNIQFHSKSIKSLDLSSNMIDSVSSFIKTVGESIEYLNLQDNLLNVIPTEINTLKDLRFLDLGYNCISTIPEWFGGLTKLEYLNLSTNIFSECQKLKVDKVFELKSLKTLKLKYTEFEMDDLYENQNLLELDIGNCRLFKVPSFVFKAVNLKKLDLSGNEISVIDQNIVNLINLEELDISENILRNIPYLVDLKKLKTLNLAFNRLNFEIYDFSDFKELVKLDISNKFTENSSLKYLKIPDSLEVLGLKGHLRIEPDFNIEQEGEGLKSIFLSGCDLTTIPVFLSKFDKISSLDLSYNKLENPWEQMKDFKNLRRLSLKQNLVTSFKKADHLFESLEYLDISKNNISILPYNFKEFQQLKTLIIVDCNIKSLDFDFSDLPELTTLVTNAPFRFYNPINKKSIFDCKKLRNLVLPSIKFLNQLPDGFRKYKELRYLALNLKCEKYVFSTILETIAFFEIDVKIMAKKYTKLAKSSYLNNLLRNELIFCMSFDSIEELDLNKNYPVISDDKTYYCNHPINSF